MKLHVHVSKASLQHQAGTRYFAEQLCFSLSCSTRCHLWRHCSNGLIACTVEARFMGTQVFLLWAVVPFSLRRFFVVLSVSCIQGLTAVCCACEVFWPLQSGAAFVCLLGKFDLFSRQEGLLTNQREVEIKFLSSKLNLSIAFNSHSLVTFLGIPYLLK